jgi:hypothetical protein
VRYAARVAKAATIGLKCAAETLDALASGLTAYAPVPGAPEWLVSAVWIEACGRSYVVTGTVEVLGDGFVARSLWIGPPDEMAEQIRAELPNVSDRLLARGNGIELPPAELPAKPGSLTRWPESYSTHILVRTTQRAAAAHSVACGLLLTCADGRKLLIASDPSTLALVMSEDPELIQRYRKDCDTLTPAEYRVRCAAS